MDNSEKYAMEQMSGLIFKIFGTDEEKVENEDVSKKE